MRVRRFILSVHLLLAFALGGGQIASQPATATQAGQMDHAMDMAMNATDSSAPGQCDGCGGGGGVEPACVPVCITIPAMLPDVVAVPVHVVAVSPSVAADQHVSGWATPPDPYPPKLISLV